MESPQNSSIRSRPMNACMVTERKAPMVYQVMRGKALHDPFTALACVDKV